jgi:hypothetical protein
MTEVRNLPISRRCLLEKANRVFLEKIKRPPDGDRFKKTDWP